MVNKDIIKEIRKDFPEEAIQVKKSFKDPETGEDTYLVGYKPQYIIERMNDVFGHDKWDFRILKHEIEGNEVWVLGQITVVVPSEGDGPDSYVVKQQFGQGQKNRVTSLGDTLKGAATNAFEKCCSMLDIGHKAYKGLETVPGNHKYSKGATKSKEAVGIQKARETLLDECKKAKIDKGAFPVLVKNVLKEEKTINEMDEAEIIKLAEHLKKNGAPF